MTYEQYDQEEREILEAYETGQLSLSRPLAEELAAIKATAENTFKKDTRITVRVYAHDFKSIKKKALQLGIPYHALISGIIHQYVEGELVPKTVA